MDEFLREINIEIFKKWIFLHHSKDIQISYKDETEDTIVLKTNYSYSEVCFNAYHIIELSVTNPLNDDIVFYLHFQLNSLKHAIELFDEMLDTIKNLIDKPVTKVLLCCSGGLTTSYFASKLNEASNLLDLDFQVDAIGYQQLFDVGNQYDIILLAPQISYQHAKAQETLKDTVVLKIPPAIFAKYDAGHMLSILEDVRTPMKTNTIKNSQPISIKKIKHNIKALCISLIRNSYRVHIVYRLYGHNNEILLDNEIIKNKISLQDIFDVIDIILIQHPDIQIICLCMPGIINDGHIASMHVEGLEDMDIQKVFSRHYDQQLILSNDVNAVAVGYHASQNKYHNLSFMFQPVSCYSGVGHIINDKLHAGHANIAGEVQFLPLDLSANKLELNKTPEGTIELIAKTMLAIITMVAPDAIVFCNVLLPDLRSLQDEIAKYIPKEYIPDIIQIHYLQEYIVSGQMILCLQSLNVI